MLPADSPAVVPLNSEKIFKVSILNEWDCRDIAFFIPFIKVCGLLCFRQLTFTELLYNNLIVQIFEKSE